MQGKPGGLSTFGGVFTPSILTILGVIMYLRFGWVVGNGGLMKILAYLLQTSVEWQNANVLLNVVAADADEAQEQRNTLEPVVDQLRTGASLNVILAEGRTFEEIVHDTSAGADIVFLGMATPEEEDDYVSYYTRLQERTERLPPTVFVSAAGEISFREVLT